MSKLRSASKNIISIKSISTTYKEVHNNIEIIDDVKVERENLFLTQRVLSGIDSYAGVYDPDNPTRCQDLWHDVKTVNDSSLTVLLVSYDVNSSNNYLSNSNIDITSEDKIMVFTKPKTEIASRATKKNKSNLQEVDNYLSLVVVGTLVMNLKFYSSSYSTTCNKN